MSLQSINQSINQSNYFIVRPKVDKKAGQLSLLLLGITKIEKIELKHKTDEQISPVNGLKPFTGLICSGLQARDVPQMFDKEDHACS